MFRICSSTVSERESSRARMSSLCESDNVTQGYCAMEVKVRETETWRVFLGELTATALLLLLSCLPVCAAPGLPASLLTRALTSGLSIALLVQCFDHISGAHMNPAITLTAVLFGRVSPTRGAALVAAQALGGIAGAAVVIVLSDDGVARCVTMPQGVAWRAVVVEAVCTACLALVNLSSWDIRNHRWRDSWPLRVGFSVSALTLVSGDVSGASFNPLRSFATALLSARWEHHWVYWVGPLSGAASTAALYVALWRPRLLHTLT